MSKLKMSVLAAVMAAAFASFGAITASATELSNASGMVTTGSTIAASAEGTTTLHPPIGDIECSASVVEGTTSNTGSSTETVSGNISKLTFTSCNATVTVLTKGNLEIHTRETSANNNGTLTSSGTEVTVEFIGFHCIFKTNSTDIGTLTGSAKTGSTATLDIEATIPRTGGRSGAFCGSTAQWTGSYKITTPDTLNVDGGGSGGLNVEGTATGFVGITYAVDLENPSESPVSIEHETVSDPTVLEKGGSGCGTIPATSTCSSRTVKCLKAGEATFTATDTPSNTDAITIRCDG